MSDSKSLLLLSFGSENEQYFVNRDGSRHHWLTRIRRDTRLRTKIRIKKEDYFEMRDTIEKIFNAALHNRSFAYIRTQNDASFRRMIHDK